MKVGRRTAAPSLPPRPHARDAFRPLFRTFDFTASRLSAGQSRRGDFCEFVDTVSLPYSEANKETHKHDEFRCETLKDFFAGRRFCDITPMLVTGYVNERLKSTTVRREVLEDWAAVNKRRSPTTVRKEVVLLSSISSTRRSTSGRR